MLKHQTSIKLNQTNMLLHKQSKKTELNTERKAENEKKWLKLDTSKRSSQALILTVRLCQIYHKSLNKQLIALS